jgi:stage III sporulation protein SpoIIIAA
VDELGAEDVPSILPLTRSGIPLIASLHATSLADALERRLMKPLYEADVFHIFGGIFRTGGSVLTKITDKDGNLC